jgi:hypothetical protein
LTAAAFRPVVAHAAAGGRAAGFDDHFASGLDTGCNLTFGAIHNLWCDPKCTAQPAHADSIADSVADERAPVLGLPFKGQADRPASMASPGVSATWPMSCSENCITVCSRQVRRDERSLDTGTGRPHGDAEGSGKKEYDTHDCILPCTCTPFCTGIRRGWGKNSRPRLDSPRVGGCGPEFKAGFPAKVRFASFDALHGTGQELCQQKTRFPSRSPSAAAKMLPVEAARRTTGTPGRAPQGAAALTTRDEIRCLRIRCLIHVSRKRKGTKVMCTRCHYCQGTWLLTRTAGQAVGASQVI